MLRSTSCAAAFLAACLLQSPASAVPYTFTQIAGPGGALVGFPGKAPALNNDGTVAYLASVGGGEFAYFAGNGASSATELFRAPQGTFSEFPSFNDEGQLAFVGSAAPGVQGIIVADGSSTAAIYDTSGEILGFSSPVQINNSGTVSFLASTDSISSGIFRGSGGPLDVIADSNSGAFTGFAGDPALNSHGLVAFAGCITMECGDLGGIGLFTGDGGTPILIADTSGAFDFLGTLPSMNDDGIVLFRAELRSGGIGLFLGDGGLVTTLAHVSDGFSDISADFAINSEGAAAFLATTSDGRKGIFLGDDPLNDNVIVSGDDFFGSTIDHIVFSREGLNDRGQVTFYATLDDGTDGIFRATPIPEPSTALLLGFGLVGLAMRLRQPN